MKLEAGLAQEPEPSYGRGGMNPQRRPESQRVEEDVVLGLSGVQSTRWSAACTSRSRGGSAADD